MEKNTFIVETASDSYEHFVFGSIRETSEERRSFAGKASKLIDRMVETLGGEKHCDIVKRYPDREAREAYKETHYWLVDDARKDPPRKPYESHGGAGWNRLETALNKDMEEGLQLAKDLDSLYSEVNSLVFELLKQEAVSDEIPEAAPKKRPNQTEKAGRPKVDVDYLAPAMQKLNAVTADVLSYFSGAWSHDVQSRKRSYYLANPEIKGQLDEYGGKLLNAAQTANAQFLAALGLCQPDAAKLTESELNSTIEKYRGQLLNLGASLQKAMAGDVEGPAESSPVGMFG